MSDRDDWERAHARPGHEVERFRARQSAGRRVIVLLCSCGARWLEPEPPRRMRRATIAWLVGAAVTVAGLLARLALR
jgi:hypothetical protein